MTSGQNKSQNEKFENQKKCQILKSWFYTKIPQKYFFGRIFPKKLSNPQILVFCVRKRVEFTHFPVLCLY